MRAGILEMERSDDDDDERSTMSELPPLRIVKTVDAIHYGCQAD